MNSDRALLRKYEDERNAGGSGVIIRKGIRSHT